MHAPKGFTLLELLVALLLLDLGLLCLVGASALAARELAVARLHTAAAQAAARRVEELGGSPCSAAASGRAIHADGLREHWTVEPEVRGARSVRDSVEFDHPRGRGVIVLRGVIRC